MGTALRSDELPAVPVPVLAEAPETARAPAAVAAVLMAATSPGFDILACAAEELAERFGLPEAREGAETAYAVLSEYSRALMLSGRDGREIRIGRDLAKLYSLKNALAAMLETEEGMR